MESALTLRDRVALIQERVDVCLTLIDRLEKCPEDQDAKRRLAVEGREIEAYALDLRTDYEAQAADGPDCGAKAKRGAHADPIETKVPEHESLDEAVDNLERFRADVE